MNRLSGVDFWPLRRAGRLDRCTSECWFTIRVILSRWTAAYSRAWVSCNVVEVHLDLIVPFSLVFEERGDALEIDTEGVVYRLVVLSMSESGET